jgi:predicted dehydrogenase
MAASSTVIKLGIIGCGRAAEIHLGRLLSLAGVEVVGFTDMDRDRAAGLANQVAQARGGETPPVFTDHRELLREAAPTAIGIFTPHLWHYRAAMDALQAGAHVFIEKPLTTNAQEATDIVGLAQGRSRKVAVGHQYRLRPSLIDARRHLLNETIGPLRLVTATLAQPWLATHEGAENSWRFDPRISGGGVLADAGDHLIDAVLWTTGQPAEEVCAIQSRLDSGLDVVTSAVARLRGGVTVSLAVSGVSPNSLFELKFYGEKGNMTATEHRLEIEGEGLKSDQVLFEPPPEQSIDENFISALLSDAPLCCPADQALDTVRFIEAAGRSASTGQLVRLV